MAKKYYAVRKGKKTGVFETWAECQKQVTGFSGAEFKSFPTKNEAWEFVKDGAADFYHPELPFTDDTEKSESAHLSFADENTIIAYVDGSFFPGKAEFSYGMVILRDGKEYTFSEKIEDAELAKMHNVAGEIKGSEAAMQYAIDNKIPNLVIYHDYEGIAKWCTGAWKANKPGTIRYQEFYNKARQSVNIRFVKVQGHSGDKYNDMADELAKEALGIL